MEYKNILLTGAGGFLGTELISQLLDLGKYKIFALTSNRKKLVDYFGVNKNLVIIELDLWNVEKVPWLEIDILIHCAFSRGYRSKNDIAESLKFTNELFMSASKMRIKAIVNISSQGVYGQYIAPLWYENTLVGPDTIYGFAKYASEIVCSNVKSISEGDTKITNLRLASLTGGNEGLKMEVISKFVDDALTSGNINIVGGSQIFSYMDVRDAASAIIKLISTDSLKWREIFNLGSNKYYNIIELANLVKIIGEKYSDKKIVINVEQKDINLHVGMDSSLFYENIEWNPKYDITDTIDSLFRYLISKKSTN